MHKAVFQKLYVTKAIPDTVNKKQLLILLPFLGAQSFLIRKLLQSCIRNHLPYCSLRISFQSKTRLYTTQLIMESQKDTYLLELLNTLV